MFIQPPEPVEEAPVYGDLNAARQAQATRGGYLLRTGDQFLVLDAAEALDRGWTPEILALAPFVGPGELAPPEFPLPGRSRAVSRRALAAAAPAYAGLMAALVFGNPWGPHSTGTGTGRVPGEADRQRMVDVELQPGPQARPLPAAHDRNGKAPGPVNPDPGGSTGSRSAVVPGPAVGVPDDLGFLGEARVATDLNLSPAQVVLVAAHPLLGPGSGRGRGGGQGDGIGAGSGPKGGWTRAEYARLAAEGKPLNVDDYVITKMPTPYYVFRPGEQLDGSVVLVRLLVGGNGIPVFAEALSGREVLRRPTTDGALLWRFQLTQRAQAKAPVTVLVRYRWVLSR